jgi:imidazolonepropionase-like amidohydrolase
LNRRVKALTDVSLIDGTGKYIKKATIIIEGSRIKEVGKETEVKIPESAEVIEFKGKTVIPGLIDCHVHLMGLKEPSLLIGLIEPESLKSIRAIIDAWKILNAGFTTVRDAGSNVAISLKRAIDEGTIIGPRIIAAGLAIL